jgi:hypothetical protein
VGTRSLASINLAFRMTGSVTNLLSDGTRSSISHPNLNDSITLVDGIESGQVNRAWEVKATLLSGASITYDLYDMTGIDIGAGAGNDALGAELIIENIVAIAILNDNDTDEVGDLEIIPGASDGWALIGTHTQATGGALKGQGMLCIANPKEGGFDVNSGSCNITLTAVGGDIDYQISILGRNDDEGSSSSSSSASSQSSSSSASSSHSSTSTSSQSSSSASSSASSSSSPSSSSVSPSSPSSSSASSSSPSSSSPSLSSPSSSSLGFSDLSSMGLSSQGFSELSSQGFTGA